MQIEQLHYIVSIAKNGTFSKAAQELHVSQSAISQSVNRLENHLGVKIFERSHKGVTVTVQGEQLIKIAAEIISKIHEFEKKAEEFKNTIQKELKIGLVTGLHLPFLPKVLSKIKEEFPLLEIKFTELASLDIIESILNKQLDIGIIALYNKTYKYKNLIKFKKFHKIQLFVLVDKHSPLIRHDKLKPELLKDQMFVMFNGEYMSWFFNELNKKYGPFKLMFTSNNNETITEAVRNGIAISIETESEVRSNPYIKNGEIKAIPLVEEINQKNHLGLAKLKNKASSKETLRTIQYLENEITDLFKSPLNFE